MTTPYRKAAEVNEPRVRYGWRLTSGGETAVQLSAFAIAMVVVWSAYAIWYGHEVRDVVGYALGVLSIVAATNVLYQLDNRYINRRERP